MSSSDWFRRTTWTTTDKAEFEARLRRSRGQGNKAQYLRIQAAHLEHDADPPLPAAALELLDRVVQEFPEPVQLVSAHEQRGTCLVALDRPAEALLAFRTAIAAQRDGTRMLGYAYCELAELVVALSRLDLYEEALAAIDARWREEPFPLAQFRSAAAAAMLCDRLGRSEEAGQHARRALEAAEKSTSPFRRHPRLGLVGNLDRDVKSELQRIAASRS